jgi:hypothetical protein
MALRPPTSYADRLPERRTNSPHTLRAFVVLVMGLVIVGFWSSRSPYAAHVSGDRPPIQELVELEPWRVEGATIRARATFEVNAVLIHKERYWLGRETELAPWDLGVGWGELADGEMIRQFKFFHSHRFFYWRTDDEPPIPVDELGASISNIHAIPADSTVRARLRRLDAGDRIVLRGYLVDVMGDDGWEWNTSLSRTDDGAGACELMWITAVERVD